MVIALACAGNESIYVAMFIWAFGVVQAWLGGKVAEIVCSRHIVLSTLSIVCPVAAYLMKWIAVLMG